MSPARKITATIGAIVFGIAISHAAQAEQAFNVQLTGKSSDKSVVHALAKGHLFIQSHTVNATYSGKDTKNPMSGMKGSCFGSVEVKGASASGGGYCLFKDTEGKKITISWQSNGVTRTGGNVGTWAIIGGEGKWATASGGGKYSAQTDNKTGVSTNNVTGGLTIK